MAYAKNINIDEDVRILIDCLDENGINKEYPSSIYMVPSMLRGVSPNSYNPRVVSIGPLHHENENLRAGQRLKTTYMSKLFPSLELPIKPTLQICLSSVNESIHIIKDCYVGMKPYSDRELARMMVIDCFFILQFLYQESTSDDLLEEQVYRDLLLLENQIPFFILQDIFKLTIFKSRPTTSLISHYIYKILHYGNAMMFKGEIKITNDLAKAKDHDHILGLLHKCYQPRSTMSPKIVHSSMRNAVELDEAGVNFEPNQDSSWKMAIEYESSKFSRFYRFWVKSTLKMPTLVIYDNTECFLRNIIAYEQTSTIVARYFTSYASVFDDLVDSHQDIAKLVESKVIVNGLGSNEEAANMINNICKNVIVSNYYWKQWEDLEGYCNSYWPRHIAWLKRKYFNNPWNIIALLAALMLFSLTVVQTHYTVNPRK